MWTPKPYFQAVASMASGTTLSTAITLPGAFDRFLVEIHSMTSGTDVYFQVSQNGTTYRRIYHDPLPANAAPGAVYLASSMTNCNVDVIHTCPKYFKVELSTAMTATTACFQLLFS